MKSPLERLALYREDRKKAEELYVILGDGLAAPSSDKERDATWREEAKTARRTIERWFGPQGRTSWTKRQCVVIPKPKVGKISVVFHGEDGEVVKVLSGEVLEKIKSELLRLLS